LPNPCLEEEEEEEEEEEVMEIGWWGVVRIHVALDRDHWRAAVNIVMDLPTP
jgi:hypothetical protein